MLMMRRCAPLTWRQEDDATHWLLPNMELIQMSGRPCLVINDNENDCVALWLLTANYQLEPMHTISHKMISWDCYNHKIVGIWDCDGILLLWFYCSSTDELLLYDVTAKKIFRADMPRDLTVKKSEYMLMLGLQTNPCVA